MKSAFYSGASGLIANQEALNNIGNNLANSNTVGYKAQQTSFEDLLYRNMYNNGANPPLVGQGVRVTGTGLVVEPSALINTGNPLDFAIAGDGWFAVQKNNQTFYTRNGQFDVSVEGSRAYLVAQDGSYVLTDRGQRITIDSYDKSEELDYSELTEKIGVYRFANPGALTPASSNRYSPSATSGTAAAAREGDYKILNMSLEQSGVSTAQELTNMITAQRAYQISARIVQVADENEQTVNNLRR